MRIDPTRTLLLSLSFCSLLALGACGPRPWMLEETTVKDAPMQLVESRYVKRVPLSSLTSDDMAKAAQLYKRNGAGPVYFVVAYNDRAKAADSRVEGMRSNLLRALAENGIQHNDLITSTIPLEVDAPIALISFDTLEATGPAGCTDMPGLHGPVADRSAFDYKLGCGVKSMMAKQVANPTDLEGVAGLGGVNDGERAANIVTTQYKTGTPRDYLPSYIISELAGSGSQ